MAWCTRCTTLYEWCTMSCTIVHWVHNAIWVLHDVAHHRVPGARYYVGVALCHAPSCTGCTMLYGWCTMLYGWCTILCSIMPGVDDATFVVHDVVHHCAPAAQYQFYGARCYMSGAQCRARLCTGCTMIYWWHHRAGRARSYLGGTRCCAPSWSGCTMLHGGCTMSCTIVHQVLDGLLVVHDVVHHHAPGAGCYMCGAQCYIGGTRCRAPSCNGCKMLYWWCAMSCTVVHRVQGTTFVVHDVVHHHVLVHHCTEP